MKTSSSVVGVVLAVVLGATSGCSSSINALSSDGAAGADAPAGTGGKGTGTGGGSAGAGGSGGGISADAGGAGGLGDAGMDAPLATGGSPDAGGDLGTAGATGGVGSGGVSAAGGQGGGGGTNTSGGAGGMATAGATAGAAGTGQGGSGTGGAVLGGAIGTGGGAGSGGSPGTDGGTTAPPCGYECRTLEGVTGWYLHGQLVCEAACLGCTAACDAVGSRSEGCYATCGVGAAAGCASSGREGLINYMFCNDPYASAYLAWQSPDAVELSGPAVAVSATGGWLRTWSSTERFAPESPPAKAESTHELNRTQLNDLFTRLAAVDVDALPHAPLAGLERCHPTLYFRLCADCAPKTLSYPAPESVSPELASVWAWFDQIVTTGLLPAVHPRYFCSGGG
jgi:hypothetical protein